MDNPLIILEGPDCGGKTTLAKTICEIFSYPYLHSGYLGDASKDTHILYHRDLIKTAVFNMLHGATPVVMDRHWPSFTVYNDWDAQSKLFNDDEEFYAENFPELKQLPVIYVFCLPDREQVEKNYEEDKDHPWSAEQRLEHYNRYQSMYLSMEAHHPDSVFLYDYTKHGQTTSKMFKFVQSVLQKGAISG